MTLLSINRAAATAGPQLVDDPSVFGDSTTRYDGSENVFSISKEDLGVLHERINDQRLRSDEFQQGNVLYRADGSVMRRDAGVHSTEDLTSVDPNPIRQRVAPLVAEQAFPVAQSTKGRAGWVKKKRLTVLDQFGMAKPVQRSDDFELVDFMGRKYETGFITLGVAWKMSYEDYRQQEVSQLNFNEQSAKQDLCRLALRQAAERLAFLGDTSRQVLGVMNNQYIPRYISPIQFEACLLYTSDAADD